MTYRDLYNCIRDMLQKAGCDSPAFDAVCLLEDIGGVPRGGLPGWLERIPSETAAAAIEEAARQRADGRPLQYILGEWEFLNLSLEVGEGVLIPRPDTELLCETAARWLRTEAAPEVLDLCAGSGCVALGVAALVPTARVTAVELSEEALVYLSRNTARYPSLAVTIRKADILRDAAAFSGQYRAILSNPPYIPAQELPGLMREVRREPVMALDGGEDGLRFYKSIAADWIPKLYPGGFCAVEVGIGQAAAVAALFEQAGLTRLEIYRDLAGIDRVVAGFLPA